MPEGVSGVARFILEVLAVVAFRAMELITIPNRWRLCQSSDHIDGTRPVASSEALFRTGRLGNLDIC